MNLRRTERGEGRSGSVWRCAPPPFRLSIDHGCDGSRFEWSSPFEDTSEASCSCPGCIVWPSGSHLAIIRTQEIS
jgi:hypothetical protein